MTCDIHSNTRIREALRHIAEAPLSEAATPLAALVAALRPGKPGEAGAVERLECLAGLLAREEPLRDGLRSHLLYLFTCKRQIRLYTDTGILGNEGFFSSMWTRITQRVLPEAIDPSSLHDFLAEVFTEREDHAWVDTVPDTLWVRVLDTLDITAAAGNPAFYPALGELLDAIEVLSLRIAATGLEPEFVRNDPDIERFESPFITQSALVRSHVEACKRALGTGETVVDEAAHILALLDRCEEVLAQIRERAARNGTSISLTWHLARLRQHIARLRTLLAILAAQHDPLPMLALFRELVRAINRRHSVSDLVTETTDLLARQVTAHAARTGEHYITTSRRGWFAMLKAGLGAGMVVGFMAVTKMMIGLLQLPVFTEALLFSLNYAAGFVLVHMLGFTIATKQPAMTAQAIAASISRSGDGEHNLASIAQIITRTLRSQFAAIIGNVSVALPVACGIIALLHLAGAVNIPPPAKVGRLLHDLNPLTSLAVLHAGIAGVCLFLAGLISGYFDNKAVYARIPQRLRQHRGLRRLLGEAWTLRISDYAERNLGALAGNISLGFMLGSIGAIGTVTGLPLDIRHVTFASANLGIALAAHDGLLPWQVVLWSASGILLIGLTNLAVSFALALNVATKSRGIRFAHTRELLRILWRQSGRNPLYFLLPPRDQDTAPKP